MSVVILGASHAGVAAAAQLRDSGYDGQVTLIHAGQELPYHRPPLSKAYLAGEMTRDRLMLRGEQFYTDKDITLLRSEWAHDLDVAAGQVRLTGGWLPFDQLIVATGSSNRQLPASFGRYDNLVSLRDLADADQLKAAIEAAHSLVIVGGGFIGLEIAATARKAGKLVTVLEMQSQLLPRVMTGDLASHILARHQSEGVDVRLNTQLAGFRASGTQIRAVETADGQSIDADLVIVGIGAHANGELAAAAGLAVSNGIEVDRFCRTSSDHIFAIGDCALAPSDHSDSPIRLESVQNAVDQGKAVAKTIAGTPTPYTDVPWFWSDQYDIKLQMAGLPGPDEQTVVRGDPSWGRFSLGFLREGRLTAMHSVNQPADHMAARRLIQAAVPLSAEQIADTASKLKDLLTG